MDFENEINHLQEILNLRNSNQIQLIPLFSEEHSIRRQTSSVILTKEPLDTLLIGDEVISTTPERENDEFIKSSVDDLVPIPKESE
ncbi:hypothetical protein Tco_0317486 [Tanacetum coccineum]